MTLIERLSEHRALADVPRTELEWLAAHGETRTYEDEAVIVPKSQPVTDLIVLLTGGVAVHFGHGTGRMHKMGASAGEMTGLLPFSRMIASKGDAKAVGHTEMLAIDRQHFPELIRECPTVTAKLVHAMVDRARVAAATDWQDEKMTSLGRLAAGFSHHLNNPASAAVRGARQFGVALSAVGEAAHALGRANLSDAQHADVEALLYECRQAPSGPEATTLDRADLEDELTAWLSARNVDTSIAQALADRGTPVDRLDALASNLPANALGPALRWVAAEQTAHSLLSEVCEAGERIHNLVESLTRFTSMDRAPVAQPMDVAQGLRDTSVAQEGRAAAKSVQVRFDIAPNLPMVKAHSADLNQVWSHLLENAIDAAQSNGEVTIAATSEPDAVTVRVIDDGAGITPEVQARMFDPFFTTKDEGEGMGFGLDIVRRIVHMHDGEVSVDTRPGRTEFRVRIPVNSSHS